MNRSFSFPAILIFSALLLSMEAKAQNIPGYSVYKVGDFIVSSRQPMKVDFMMKNTQFKNALNKDTLYDDGKYLILGNSDVLAGVYKKYKVPYDFSAYKVSVYKGKLAQPDFRTDTAAWEFRTQIRSQCKENGINFAGHFTVVQWGCGTECSEFAIVDRITGHIYYSSIYHSGINYLFNTLLCKPDSNMAIMNDWMLDGFKGYVYCDRPYWKLKVVEWVDFKFRVLTIQD